jgi:hypothetical protein
MLMRKGSIPLVDRSVLLAIIAALVLTTSETPLIAAPVAHAPEGISTAAAARGATDLSSRHRHHHRHYHRGGNAAAAAFFGLAIGSIVGTIAAERRRQDCYDYGYCGGGYYYGGPYYYGRRYYYPPY